jgi:hypothetical protein
MSTGMTRADTQAEIAKLTSIDAATVTIHTAGPDYTTWTATSRDGGTTVLGVMPSLKPRAPKRLRRWMRDRAVANMTGACPRCRAATGIADSGNATQMNHEADCTIGGDKIPPDLRRHILPKSREWFWGRT